MVRGRMILLLLVLAAPSWARAADPIMTFSESTAMLAKICGAEITANCRGVNLDSNRLKECLSRNQDVMSPSCKASYLVPFDQIQKRINARLTVAGACRLEIIKLCHGSTKETSKSVACLLSAKGVSRNCTQATIDAGYR
ncbi:MAG: hypothetical protein JOZ74_15335 [Bradyrhizobium sp.]|nr:hypothetical protein [Bradyrhizobium sp.]